MAASPANSATQWWTRRRIVMALWLLLGIVVLLVPVLWNTQAEAHRATGPNAIRRVLDDQVLAWNRGDLEGFMQGYWASEELAFVSGGKTTQGWQATLDGYQQRYQAEGKEMGQLAFSDVEVEMASHDAARVTGRWNLMRKAQRDGGTFALNFRRFESEWKIVRDETTSDETTN